MRFDHVIDFRDDDGTVRPPTSLATATSSSAAASDKPTSCQGQDQPTGSWTTSPALCTEPARLAARGRVTPGGRGPETTLRSPTAQVRGGDGPKAGPRPLPPFAGRSHHRCHRRLSTEEGDSHGQVAQPLQDAGRRAAPARTVARRAQPSRQGVDRTAGSPTALQQSPTAQSEPTSHRSQPDTRHPPRIETLKPAHIVRNPGQQGPSELPWRAALSGR